MRFWNLILELLLHMDNFCFSFYSRCLQIVNATGSGRFGAVKSDSTHHFFGNTCTKSEPLRFSQFSGCWLILSVCSLMKFCLSLWKIARCSVILLLPLIIRRVWRYQSCRDRMVVLFTFILCITSLSPQNLVCVFSIPADGEVYSIQPHYKKF